MKRLWIQWIVGFSIGALLTFSGFLALYPTRLSPEAREAALIGADPRSYIDARSLQRKAQNENNLSPDEIARMRVLSQNSSWQIRVRVLSALSHLTDSAQACEATRIARACLSDPEWVVRQRALKALDKLKAPDVRSSAELLLHDENLTVRTEAKNVIANLSDKARM